MTVSLIGKRIGNYDIQSQLGEGGMGTVYLGMHPQIGKKVAVKVLHEELASKQDVVTRFFNEAKSVNDISHPNIVDIVDFGETNIDGAHFKYIIMEFLDGDSLSARIRSAGVTIRETLYIIAQAASALSASHQKGVVHRDLKPENIFLCGRGGDKNYVKLLDFGIAKLTGDQAALSQKTRTGMVIGTPAYMSPEQCEGRGLIDHRSDIYALGVVMYELLTGRVPFPGDGFGEVLVAHLTRDPPAPTTLNPNIPPEIEAIVLHCLRKDKAGRFQTMDELLAALNDPMGHFHAFTQTAQLPQGTAAADAGMGTLVLGAGQSIPGLPPGVPPGHQGHAVPAGASAPWALPASLQQGGSGMMPVVAQSYGGATGPEGPRMTGVAVRTPTGSGLHGADVLVHGGQGPRPTTMSGAAGETAGGRRPVSVMLGFLGAMLIGVVAMVGVRALRKQPDVVATAGQGGQGTMDPVKPPVTPPSSVRPANPPSAKPPEPVKPALVKLRVESTPPGAEVVRDDVLDQGKPTVTPATIEVKQGASLGLKFKLDGYNELTKSVVASADQAVTVTLEKVAKADDVKPSGDGDETKDSGKKKRDKDKTKKPGRKPRGGDKKLDDLPPVF